MNAALRTRLCDLVGVRLPIVQTGMGWVAGARLVSATAEAGGLGILAAATMSRPQLADAIARVRARTSAPFGVNLRGDQPDLADLLDLLVRERVAVASFARAPGRDALARLRDAGVITIPTVGAPRHAEKVVAWGASAVIAQGGEGGGHTGVVPSSLLIPAVVDAVDVPVVAAGGFRDGRGLVAALAWGADGVAMGTRFLLTRESHVPDAVKQAYLRSGLDDTVVTRAVDGVPQRVVRTPFVERLEARGPLGRLVVAARHALALRGLLGTRLVDLLREARAMRRQGLPWSEVLTAASAPIYTRAALVDGHLDAGVLPAGQVVGSIDELPSVAELLARIEAEAEAALARLGAPTAPPLREVGA